ncbi:hypothetical protein ACJZ2D_003413 [Fusarium nematophilum]
MKFLTFLIASMAATSSASPGPLPMGVEVVERDGKTIVREVPHQLLGRGLQSRCRECVGQGDHCTIGDGSCFAEDPPLYCTWCGDKCGSICVRQGQNCQNTCV